MNDLDVVSLYALGIVSIINLILVGIVFRGGKINRERAFFGGVIASIVAWTAVNYLADNTLDALWALVWTKLIFSATSFLSWFLISFAIVFPQDSSQRAGRWFIPIFFVPNLLIQFLLVTPLIVSGVEMYELGVIVKFGSLQHLYSAYLLAGIVGSIILLIGKLRKVKGPDHARVLYVLYGLGLLLVFATITNYVIPVMFDYFYASVFGPYFSVFFTGFTTAAIVKYKLLDLRPTVIRSLSFTFLLGIFFAFYAAVLIVAVPFFSNELGVSEAVTAAIGALLSIILAKYVQDILRKITDTFLFQQQADYRAALILAGRKLSQTINIDEVTRTIIEVLSKTVRSSKVVILLYDPTHKAFLPRAAFGARSVQYVIGREHVLAKHLQHSQGPLLRSEIVEHFEEKHGNQEKEAHDSQEISKTMEWLDVECVIPLFVDRGLTGILLAGGRLSGLPYGRDEVEFLEGFAPQAATALENARLYKESLEFGEKLKVEVKRATLELETANKQLKDLDKAKSEFLSIASHQLYTPLTALRGYLSMLLEGDFGSLSEKQQPIISILNQSSTRLIELIRNLLDISRIESGRLELKLESVDLVQMAKELVQDLMPNALNKSLELNFHPPKEAACVVADSQRIRQVMLNFVDNSIKYTDRGTVDVYVQREKNDIVFWVTDTGKGLSQDEIVRLFTKFTRVGGASRYHTEGTGLGLYVARQIVREHHGEVEAESPGKEKGSTFRMRLPAEGAPRSLKLGDKATVVIKAAEAQGVS